MSDELQSYVEAWRAESAQVLDLAGTVSGPQWSHETDLPGWDVKDVLAHLAHLESVLAGLTDDTSMDAEGRHIEQAYAQAGVAERRDRTPDELAEEFRTAVETRSRQLADDPPTDPTAPPNVTPTGVSWDTRTLLSNRVVDVWMHDQDIRRAVGTPGNLDSPGARITRSVFLSSWPFVLAKRVDIGSEDVVRLHLTDTVEDHTWARGDDGRVETTDAEPTVTLSMSSEDLCMLAGGRRDPASLDIHVEGDRDLAERIQSSLTVTP